MDNKESAENILIMAY